MTLSPGQRCLVVDVGIANLDVMVIGVYCRADEEVEARQGDCS